MFFINLTVPLSRSYPFVEFVDTTTLVEMANWTPLADLAAEVDNTFCMSTIHLDCWEATHSSLRQIVVHTVLWRLVTMAAVESWPVIADALASPWSPQPKRFQKMSTWSGDIHGRGADQRYQWGTNGSCSSTVARHFSVFLSVRLPASLQHIPDDDRALLLAVGSVASAAPSSSDSDSCRTEIATWLMRMVIPMVEAPCWSCIKFPIPKAMVVMIISMPFISHEDPRRR